MVALELLAAVGEAMNEINCGERRENIISAVLPIAINISKQSYMITSTKTKQDKADSAELLTIISKLEAPF